MEFLTSECNNKAMGIGKQMPWQSEGVFVVGTLHDFAGLEEVRRGISGVDALEWRADLLDGSLLN